MTSNQEDMKYKAGEAVGHAQEKKEEMKDKASETAHEAGNILQRTGDQVKGMAQGAVDAVKNTLNMGDHHNSGK